MSSSPLSLNSHHTPLSRRGGTPRLPIGPEQGTSIVFSCSHRVRERDSRARRRRRPELFSAGGPESFSKPQGGGKRWWCQRLERVRQRNGQRSTAVQVPPLADRLSSASPSTWPTCTPELDTAEDGGVLFGLASCADALKSTASITMWVTGCAGVNGSVYVDASRHRLPTRRADETHT